MDATPVDVVQRHRMRIIAELNYQAELDAEFKEEQDKQKREMERRRGMQ